MYCWKTVLLDLQIYFMFPNFTPYNFQLNLPWQLKEDDCEYRKVRQWQTKLYLNCYRLKLFKVFLQEMIKSERILQSLICKCKTASGNIIHIFLFWELWLTIYNDPQNSRITEIFWILSFLTALLLFSVNGEIYFRKRSCTINILERPE